MKLRSLFLAGALAAALAAPAAARPATAAAATAQQDGVADPAAYIASVLKGERADSPFDGPESQNPLYTRRLRDAFAEDEAYAQGEVGRLDFDFFTGSQDGEISDYDVEAADVDGAPDRTVVTARFKNGGQPTAIAFYFQRQGDRWLLDDVAGSGYSSDPWVLSLILRYGHADLGAAPLPGGD